jgi:hypothetical protein
MPENRLAGEKHTHAQAQHKATTPKGVENSTSENQHGDPCLSTHTKKRWEGERGGIGENDKGKTDI